VSILDQFPVRLWWDGKKGAATYDGVHVVLRERPPGMAWSEVDWAPEAVASCRERECDAPRDLQAAEITMIRGWLAHMAQRVRVG